MKKLGNHVAQTFLIIEWPVIQDMAWIWNLKSIFQTMAWINYTQILDFLNKRSFPNLVSISL